MDCHASGSATATGSAAGQHSTAADAWRPSVAVIGTDQPAVVTYWMNRLQGHSAAQDFLVTLNDHERIDPESIVATMGYQHPIYTPEAVRAQSRLSGLATDRTVYAGAYHGWGFHEDGCRSGAEAARHFGLAW